jgi:hypothetical protein
VRLFLIYLGICSFEEACLLVQYAMGDSEDITRVWFLVPMVLGLLRPPTVFKAQGRRLIFLDLLQLGAYSYGLFVAAEAPATLTLCATLVVVNVPLIFLSLWLACRTVATEVTPAPPALPLPAVMTTEKTEPPARLNQDTRPNLLGRTRWQADGSKPGEKQACKGKPDGPMCWSADGLQTLPTSKSGGAAGRYSTLCEDTPSKSGAAGAA